MLAPGFKTGLHVSPSSTSGTESGIGRRTYLAGLATTAVALGASATPSLASAAQPAGTVVEDFERDDPLADYGGLVENFEVTDDAYEGEQAIINDSGDFAGINSTEGLDVYPERGDDVHFYFKNSGADNFLSVNLFSQEEEDNPHRYAFGISAADGFTFWRNDEEGLEAVANEELLAAFQTDGWYRMEIETSTDDDTIVATLYDDAEDTDLAQLEIEDDTFDSGGIGFRSQGEGEVFDLVVIAEEDEETPTPTEEPEDTPTPTEEPDDDEPDDDDETDDEDAPGFGVLAALAGLGAAGAAAARRFRSDEE